ncbi:MAG: 3'-5' exonuclease, partial [Elusimicrobiota bacterium]
MFRNAEYRIMRDFLDKAEGKKDEAAYISLDSLAGELKYASLPVNYRSDGEILNYVNALFKEKLKSVPELIGEDLTGLTAYSQSVQEARLKRGYVKTDVLELEDLAEPDQQKEWLLKVVRGARERYPLNEIAILVPRNKRIEPVVEWLTGAGIPVASLSSLDIRKRKVVAELIAYLKFLETPSDDLSFSDLITGDIFMRLTGLERAELMDFIFNVRAKTPSSILYAEFRNHPKYGGYWEKYLDEVFRKVGYLPLYELVSRIYGNFELFENFPEEAAFLARFMNAVMTLEAEGITSPRSFIEYASGADEDKAAVFSITLPEYIDAVRVMTFHKSKGLGFSVVINLMYDERDRSDPMYFKEKDGEIHVYHITRAAAEHSLNLRPVYEGRKTDSNIQDLNLLYVISTRARHELYNLVIKKVRKTAAKEPKLLDLFETFEAGRPEMRKPGRRLSAGSRARLSSKPVQIIQAGARSEQRFAAPKPTYTSFFETAEGELVHAMLARIAPGYKSQVTGHKPEMVDLEARLSAYFDELCPKYPFKFNKARVTKSLLAFLESCEAAPLFAVAPCRQVLI